MLPLDGTQRRLLFIGDSFTEGIGVDWPETFVGRVAEALKPRGIEVLNAGAASYCPIIYERRIRQLLGGGLRVDHVVVYVDIGDLLDQVVYKRDARGNVLGRETRRIAEERANREYEGSILALTGLERFLDRHTIAAGAAYRLLLRARAKGPRRGAAWTLDESVYEAYAREGLQLADADMTALAENLRARRIRLTVAVYPWPDQILAGDRDSKQVRFWREWAARHGAGFIDHFPDFVPDDAGERRRIARQLFIPGDIHWNSQGHALMAEGFLRQWRDDAPR